MVTIITNTRKTTMTKNKTIDNEDSINNNASYDDKDKEKNKTNNNHIKIIPKILSYNKLDRFL